MMKIHVFHTGRVCVSPNLPFGGNCSTFKAAGLWLPMSKRLWLPVSAYLVEHPKGLILVDTGWHREMSPDGVFDERAQIRSLGSRMLYRINQGEMARGEAIDEQLATLGIKPSDIDYVLLTHLDCDHANGLKLVSDAKHILVSREEMKFATNGSLTNRVRYQRKWWDGLDLTLFDWNGEEGPFRRSFDLFGDGSVQLINIPGHSDGQCAVRLTAPDGHFVLLVGDGGYATRSWRDMITSGIAEDKRQQLQSLEWIRKESENPLCVETLANHDAEVVPHDIIMH